MALTTLTDDLDIIQALDDAPNDSGGLTAAQLKAKFDEGPNAIKTYLNDTLIPELDAAHLPYDYTVLGGQTIKEALDGTVLGTLPDRTVTEAKMVSTFLRDLISAASAVIPVSADKFPFLDADGSVAGTVTLANLLVSMQGLGVPQIASGSYTGTNVYGSENPNSITTGFSVKMGIVKRNDAAQVAFFLGTGSAAGIVITAGGVTAIDVSKTSTEISWYSLVSAGDQMNSSASYDYFFIG